MPRQRISLGYDEMLGSTSNTIPIELPLEKLVSFPNHPFKPYTAERLKQLVGSVKLHGILEPVLVWKRPKTRDVYTILSGHNRVNAAKEAGLSAVPVRMMEQLSEAEAMLIVTETNLHQRSFTDLTHSERAIAIHAHYEAVKAHGKNRKLVEAIGQLCRIPSGNGRSIEKTCMEFGASQGAIARYLRIYALLPQLRELLDSGKLSLRAGVELSWLAEEKQQLVLDKLMQTGKKITEQQAKQLREVSEQLDTARIEKILYECATPQLYKLSVTKELITRYFPEKTNRKEVAATIEKALAAYFEARVI